MRGKLLAVRAPGTVTGRLGSGMVINRLVLLSFFLLKIRGPGLLNDYGEASFMWWDFRDFCDGRDGLGLPCLNLDERL
jgi:hypothetical protein